MKNISTKRKSAFVVFLILTVLWMAVIYGFSGSDGEKSKSQSREISEKIALTIEPDYEIPERLIKGEFMTNVITAVRKSAHLIVFTVLGALSYCTAGTIVLKSGGVFKPALFSVPFSILYAVSDEIHQRFVEGRFGTVRDVCIDSAGVLIGTSAMILFVTIARRVKRKKYDKIHKR